MSKYDTVDELTELLERYDKEFILQALFNYFTTSELKEFVEFIKDEIDE